MKDQLERFRAVSRKVTVKYLAILASIMAALFLTAVALGLYLGNSSSALILYACILLISIISSAMIAVFAVRELVTVEIVMTLYELTKPTQPTPAKAEESSEAQLVPQATPTARRAVATPPVRVGAEGATPVKQTEVKQIGKGEKKCPYCGRVLPFGDIHTICPYCGKRLR